MDLILKNLQSCSFSLEYNLAAKYQYREFSSVTAVSLSRYFVVYPITGGLSDRSIGVARRVKLAFRQGLAKLAKEREG